MFLSYMCQMTVLELYFKTDYYHNYVKPWNSSNRNQTWIRFGFVKQIYVVIPTTLCCCDNSRLWERPFQGSKNSAGLNHNSGTLKKTHNTVVICPSFLIMIHIISYKEVKFEKQQMFVTYRPLIFRYEYLQN